jgi:two-component system, NarL family, nitrate/nitrite response regulator NarL
VTCPALGRLRVVVADDHELARAGIRLTLDASDAFEVCAEASTARDAVDLALRERPAVCLLDVQMPGDGIEAARRIAANAPDVTIVMLSVVVDDRLFEALRAGAAGYLRKDMDPDRLPDALLGALRGEAALARQDVGRIVAEFRRRGDRRVALPDGRTVQLTEREWEICTRLLAGATTRQVALELYVAPVTVRRHVSEVVAKLHVPDRAAALDLLRSRRS